MAGEEEEAESVALTHGWVGSVPVLGVRVAVAGPRRARGRRARRPRLLSEQTPLPTVHVTRAACLDGAVPSALLWTPGV